MDRICLIVGGTGGIGQSLIRAFRNADYDVLFTFHNDENEASIISRETGARGFHVDVTKENDVKKLFKDVAERYSRLDVLVYAAGVFKDALIEKMQLDNWNYVINTNVTGCFLCVKHLLPQLRKSESARIVAIGSVMGDCGCYGSCSYAASKSALFGLIKSVALENAKYGLTANVVSFGYIDTGMSNTVPENVIEVAKKKIPLKRFGKPENAAKNVVDICSEYSDYISGQVIRVNGMMYT